MALGAHWSTSPVVASMVSVFTNVLGMMSSGAVGARRFGERDLGLGLGWEVGGSWSCMNNGPFC